MAEKKHVKKVQKKKKKWVTITAPKVFRTADLGEIPVTDEESLIGRTIKVNMMTLLKDPKKQNMNTSFIIKKIDDGKAITESYSFEIAPSSIKRFVKRRKDKIEDSFVCKTKDGKKIRVKPILITNGKVNNSTATEIRRCVRHNLAKHVASHTLDDFISGLILSKSIMKIKDLVKKIYPVKILEIRKIKIETKPVKAIDPKDYAESTKKKRPKKKQETQEPKEESDESEKTSKQESSESKSKSSEDEEQEE